MSGRLLLGIDAGQTIGKAALYDVDGREVAVAQAATQVRTPHPRWIERDHEEIWRQASAAVREALRRAGASGADVAGVGIAGHSDGLHAVDEQLRPVRPAILATDSRAHTYAERTAAGPLAARTLALTGVLPAAGSPAPLLEWLRDNESEAFAAIRWVLFCKDWIRLRLVGEVATDPTDATASFAEVRSQTWSREALDLYGLGALAGAMPPILGSAEVAGTVSAEGAAATRLAEGTPVVTGAHDVDGQAIGIGALLPGAASAVLGTFSINQVLATRPVPDARWHTRAFARPGEWLHMSTSPAGAGNLDWAIRRIGPWADGAAGGEPDPVAAMAEATKAASGTGGGEPPLFLPFVFGGPHGAGVPGTWAGLQAWHGRGDLLRAVVEGVVFNHRTHFDGLRERFELDRPVRVTGGGSRSPEWTDLLASVLDLPVEVTDAAEAGARGAALLAGVGVGVYADVTEAAERTVRVVRRQEPNRAAVPVLAARYRRYRALVDTLAAFPG